MAKARQLRLVQLYPNAMNIYGDNGNAQILRRRAELYGYEALMGEYNSYADRETLLLADLVVGGGGQDSGQRAILGDLARIKPELLKMAENKVPMLMICGLYQLFGHYFQTKDGDKMPGIGLFDMVTIGSDKRLIGNAIINTDDFGELIGYENHSGLTTLGDNQASLGRVVKGYGNDGQSGIEGAIKYATVGTYLHGPVLSKNSWLADWLISRAAERKYGDGKLMSADDEARKQLAELAKLTDHARTIAQSRPQ